MKIDSFKNMINKCKSLWNIGFLHVMIANCIEAGLSFIGTVLWVKILTKSEYGLYTYAWNIVSVILIFNGMGIESGTLQVASETKDELKKKQICEYGLKVGLVFDIILVFAIICIGEFIPLKIPSARKLILIMAFIPVAKLIYSMNVIYLRIHKRNKEYAGMVVAYSFLYIIFSCIGIIFFREKSIVWGLYFSYIICSLLAYFRYNIRFATSSYKNFEYKSIWKISWLSMLNNGFSRLLYLLDILVIGFLIPQETVLAGYKVATVIPTSLVFIPSSVMAFVYPYFAEHSSEWKWCREHYRILTLGMGVMNMMISGMLFVSAEWLIVHLFGAEYIDSVDAFRVLAISYFFAGTFRTICGNLLVTQRKLKYNFIALVISGIINILLDLCLVSRWGAIGAAWASLGVVVLMSIILIGYWEYTMHELGKKHLMKQDMRGV